ncbi:hypothetical protein GGX14DRAFT_14473 [Mycena pura]|uniref:Uncharacterized protein n=1 Tax=Mycena pura TaxID=153505 RepID=A0AAD6USM1_9AGAR|nr:hypothetical protein GGX14DRAFT_14473 [Mycena pura]
MTPITYEAPKLIQSQIIAWTTTVQSVAVATALFAVMSSILFGIMKMDSAFQGQHGHVMTLLVFSSYGAMLFNAITTLASLVFVDRLGNIELNEARKSKEHTTRGYVDRPASSLKLLIQFGARKHLRWIFFQWVTYLFVGMIFMLVEIIVYVAA